MPRVFSAGAVVFHKSGATIEYLLLQYGTRDVQKKKQRGLHWDFPKGHIESGETIPETIVREIEEETGIRYIQFIKGFKEKIKFSFVDKHGAEKTTPLEQKAWVLKMVFFHLARSRTKKVRLTLEHVNYKWLPYEQAHKQVTHKNAKEILKRANLFLKNYYEEATQRHTRKK